MPDTNAERLQHSTEWRDKLRANGVDVVRHGKRGIAGQCGKSKEFKEHSTSTLSMRWVGGEDQRKLPSPVCCHQSPHCRELPVSSGHSLRASLTPA